MKRSCAPISERLWRRVDKNGPLALELGSNCWLWLGCKNNGGYGQIIGKKNKRPFAYKVHRIAYEIVKGPIPSNLTLDHLCRVRHCVNPDHLEVVSLVENVMRGNGVGVKNSHKTHCPKGHPLVEGNVYMHLDGGKQCKICTKAAAVKNSNKPKEHREAK